MKFSHWKWLSLLTILLFSWQLRAETSTELRSKKYFVGYFDPIGFSPFFGSGIAGGLILTNKFILEVATKTGASCLDANCQYETYFSEARIKYFVGNSLFFNLGAARERSTWDHGMAWNDYGAAAANFKMRATTTGFAAAIGNMWQLGDFTLGCDWIGQYFPMNISDIDFHEGVGFNSSSREDYESKGKRSAMRTHLLFLRLHLGLAF